jgi:hypothetical protein
VSSETPTAPSAIPGSRQPFWRRPALVVAMGASALALGVLGARIIRRPAAGPSPASAAATPGVPTASAAPTDTTRADSARPSAASETVGGAPAARGPAASPESTASTAAGPAAEPTRPTARHGTKTQGVAASATRRPSRAERPGAAPPTPSRTGTGPAGPGVGTLHMDVRPAGASYTLQSLEDGRVIRGTMPLTTPLTLPTGQYALEISARYCATYRDTVRVAPSHANTPVTVRLVCGQ